MKLDKLLKEALSFSKMEGIKYSRFKGYSVTREVYMKASKIMIIISLVVLVSLVGVFLFYDNIFVLLKHPTTADVEKVKSKERVEEVVEEIKIKEPSQISAVVSMVLGDVKVQNVLGVSDLEVGYKLKEGDTIITSADSECEVQVDKKILVRISENTKVSFHQIVSSRDKGRHNVIELVSGSLKSAVKDLGRDKFKVKSSTAVAAVRGTKFSVSVDEKHNTKIVVSEGRVEVGIRSKVMQDLVQRLPEQSRELDDHFGSIILNGGNSIVIGPKEQSRIDNKLSEVLEEDEPVNEEVISKAINIGKKVASTINLEKKRASLSDLDAINSKVSKNLIATRDVVKVKFEAAKGVKDVKLFIDYVEAGKLPMSRALEKNREYHIKAQSGGKILVDKKIKFDKDSKFVIREALDEKPDMKVEESIVQKEKILNFGSKVLSGYGRWPVYVQKYVFYTPSGISTFDGEKIRNINIRGNSYSVYGDNIVVITKDQNDYLVVKVADISGKVLGEFNLGESTKGTLVVGRAVLTGNSIFVPTIDGVYIVDIKTGEKRVIRVGTVYSDLALFDQNNVISVNEIGEVYIVSASGGYRKISQLSTTTVRRGILASSSDRVYILVDSSMHIIDRGGGVKMANLGIKPESEPIVYTDKVIVAGDKKVLILSKDGTILRTITLSGNLVVSPYVGDGYVVVATTDGVHVYSIETGNQEYKFDIIGNIAFIYNKKLYVVRDTDTKVIDLK